MPRFRHLPGTLALLILLTVCTTALQAQNVVEYFGRETVEQIEEGRVVHVFSQGLALPMDRSMRGLFRTNDLVAWQLAHDRFQTPQANQPADSRFPDRIWQAVSASDDDYFQSRELRNSWLYTSVELEQEQTVLIDARGHTRMLVNGLPYEGDHFDFGYTLIPVTLKQGLNEFIFYPGRFGRVSVRLVEPSKQVQLTRRDTTLPSLIIGEDDEKWGAIRVINATGDRLEGLNITVRLNTGEEASWQARSIMPMSVRKVPVRIPALSTAREPGRIGAEAILTDASGNEIDRITLNLNIHDRHQHLERTFVSNVDGSVQYYSVAPSTSPDPGQALVLSVHGAGVEATNQARAYRPKDWAHVVAATNRRPYGYNWEDWGRIDAFEVKEDAMRIYQTDKSRSYLTGHSMGGHGSWNIGANYPDRFAALGPAAGSPDYLRNALPMLENIAAQSAAFAMIHRASNHARIAQLKRNYLQSGIYMLHGDADEVVNVENSRYMRGLLSEFHPNFVYYEYPGGSHWYGNHSLDWPPIFDFFRWQTIPDASEVDHIEFVTVSPGLSASNYWIRVDQQQVPLDFSRVEFTIRADSIVGHTENVQTLTFKLSKLNLDADPVISIGDFSLQAPRSQDITLTRHGSNWNPQWVQTTVSAAEKNPDRYGGFKNVFDNNMVFVYATYGSNRENEWYKNRARFDAETFQYRANGSVDVVADRDFNAADYAGRNVILYGNQTNNGAWLRVLGESPIVVRSGEIRVGSRRVYKGDDLATFFVQPRLGCDKATVGVIASTGEAGMITAFANDYLGPMIGYPDLLIFSSDMLTNGLDGILLTGWFGNDWSVETGDFSY